MFAGRSSNTLRRSVWASRAREHFEQRVEPLLVPAGREQMRHAHEPARGVQLGERVVTFARPLRGHARLEQRRPDAVGERVRTAAADEHLLLEQLGDRACGRARVHVRPQAAVVLVGQGRVERQRLRFGQPARVRLEQLQLDRQRVFGALRKVGRRERARQRPGPAARSGSAAVDQVLGELHALARVAARDLVDRGGQGCDVGHVAEQRLEQRPGLLGGKRLQRRATGSVARAPRARAPVRRRCPTSAARSSRLRRARSASSASTAADGSSMRCRSSTAITSGCSRLMREQTAADRSDQRCRVALQLGRVAQHRLRRGSRGRRRSSAGSRARTARGSAAPSSLRSGRASSRCCARSTATREVSLLRRRRLARSTVAPSILASSAHASSMRERPRPGCAADEHAAAAAADARAPGCSRSAASGSSRPTSVGVGQVRRDTAAVSSRARPAIAASRCITSDALRGRSAGSRLSSDSTSASSAGGMSGTRVDGGAGVTRHASSRSAKRARRIRRARRSARSTASRRARTDRCARRAPSDAPPRAR